MSKLLFQQIHWGKSYSITVFEWLVLLKHDTIELKMEILFLSCLNNLMTAKGQQLLKKGTA